jgi:hypothetical protein
MAVEVSIGAMPRPRKIVATAASQPARREEGGIVRRYVCELCGDVAELSALARSRLAGTQRTLSAEERERYLG